ncbi:MAG: right-handed parallel beta-helix repeat-containing protein [Candidatus Thiodiazotropha sp. (ex Troendleina suluensis)]|nr:right-handed parallel beta-helix repeat-containing protein [Candidatus Thiodiazotropha sp. (ex Troendleina suluensis)]
MFIGVEINWDGTGRFQYPDGDYPGGGGGHYTPPPATHYVDENATGTGDGSIGSPWTVAQMIANAAGGNSIRLNLGTLLAPTTDDRFAAAFMPDANGTAENPIVIWAENEAANTPNTALRTKLTTNATIGSANGCPVIGGARNHVIWHGVWIDEVDAVPTADTGPVTLNNCVGVKILGCVLDGTTPTHDTWASAPTENHNGIRIEGANDCVIADNKITGFKNPGGSHNGAGIMTYTSTGGCDNNLIENNEISECGCGIYVKAQAFPATSGNYTIRKNLVHSNQNAGIEFGGHTGAASYVYQNITSGNVDGIMLGRDEVDNVKCYNNTSHDETRTSLYLKTAISSHSGNEYGNNLSINPGASHITGDAGPITADIVPDYNFYDLNSSTWYINSTNYGSFSAYVAGSGVHEGNSINADPVIVGGGDYTPDTGSPLINAALDVLDILGGGTSAAINMGAVVNSDTIGVRST